MTAVILVNRDLATLYHESAAGVRITVAQAAEGRSTKGVRRLRRTQVVKNRG